MVEIPKMRESDMFVRRNASGRHEVVEVLDRGAELILRTLDSSQEASQFIELVKEGKRK